MFLRKPLHDKLWPLWGINLQHVFTTSYLSHTPIDTFIAAHQKENTNQPFYISSGRVIGLRMIPTERDLRFLWEEMPQQQLDEQSQKVQQSLHSALLNWAKTNGEAEDYRDNVLLGYHIQQQKAMTVEVISRKLDDRGGGVAVSQLEGGQRRISAFGSPHSCESRNPAFIPRTL